VLIDAKRDLMSRARDIGDKALIALEAILEIQRPRAPARVAAAVAVLDRAYGKPPQLTTSSVETLKKATELTDDELAESIDAVREFLGDQGSSRANGAARATTNGSGTSH
jgi:hypothetical protein